MIESFVNQVFMLGRSDVCNAGSISSLYVLLYSYTQATSGHEMCGLGTRLVHTLLIWFDWSKWIGYIPGQALSVFVHWYWKWCETSPGLGWIWPQGTTRTMTFLLQKIFVINERLSFSSWQLCSFWVLVDLGCKSQLTTMKSIEVQQYPWTFPSPSLVPRLISSSQKKECGTRLFLLLCIMERITPTACVAFRH